VATGVVPRADLEAAGPDFVLDTLEEALALIGPRAHLMS
jgi:phosphoglycolate phosphatase-like HAD superfamily hydrolase